MNKVNSEEWDKQLLELIEKYPIPKIPEIPPGITFPFMIVYYRKKLSLRNNNYLMAVPIFTIADHYIIRRNLTHKGWPIQTLIFDIPEFMKSDHEYSRYSLYKYHDWDHINKILSDEDKKLLPQLKELYPCKTTYMKEKNGQYKFII
jgi:hypothetical protein